MVVPESHPNLSIPYLCENKHKIIEYRHGIVINPIEGDTESIVIIYSPPSKRYWHLLEFDTLLDKCTPQILRSCRIHAHELYGVLLEKNIDVWIFLLFLYSSSLE